MNRVVKVRRTQRAAMAATLAIGVALCGMTAPGATSPTRIASSPSGFHGASWGDAIADALAKKATGKNVASADPGSLYTVENAIGARAVWAQTDAAGRQVTGQGVSVALLDSGTAAVPGLTGTGKLAYGPDLSVESNGVLTDQDTFGHGTFMAGIIAGRDSATLTAKTIPKLDPGVQLGVAPDAGLVSIKLADTDGSSDVSQIIAALNWVTEHQTAPDGSKIRVVNLSFGTDSVQAYQRDPLAAAAENAWRHGLVVVVSGGNEGTKAGRLTDPAMDPYVLAVGASTSSDSIIGWTKTTVAPFSSSGTNTRHVDLLAPGTSLVSLRDPGSTVDVNNPGGLVSGDTTGRLFRGSGTSQAAAVVSGAVALLLQAAPKLTPDQVKAVLTSTADPVLASSIYAGSGELNIAAAVDAVTNPLKKVLASFILGSPAQSFAVSTGQGTLNAARGGTGLTDADGTPISGEVDAQGNPWNSAAWWAKASALTSWSGGTWNGATWTGNSWNTTGTPHWSSARWSSARWSDADWSSARWSSSRWSSARWSGSNWG